MSVDIEPLELSFRRPFTVEVAQVLTIKNPNTQPIAFKVKTTAPKQYCVRPNAGRIEPGQDFNVSVLLQAMKQEPAADAKCRDKFLVQSATITPDKEFASIASVLDSAGKANVQERKIRVIWLPAEHDEGAPNEPIATPNRKSTVNGNTDTPEASRTYSSPGAADSGTPASAPPPYMSDDAGDDEAEDAEEAPKSAVSKAASAVSTKAQLTYEELKAKLAQAEAELGNLKVNGLRQRVKGTDGEKRPVREVAQAVKQNIEGVPVQIVAALCLVSFLLAYFFF